MIESIVLRRNHPVDKAELKRPAGRIVGRWPGGPRLAGGAQAQPRLDNRALR